jgi:hypothetical protein
MPANTSSVSNKVRVRNFRNKMLRIVMLIEVRKEILRGQCESFYSIPMAIEINPFINAVFLKQCEAAANDRLIITL